MEERMTVCNMSIEAGARAGMIAPDETTYQYLKKSSLYPKGRKKFESLVAEWKKIFTDEGAIYDKRVEFHADDLIPQVTWGTSPGMGTGITDLVPDPESFTGPEKNKKNAKKRLCTIWDWSPELQ
ncbi:hypothetical protein GCM10020331_090750 [Ectobacillus funiculus]